VSAVIAILNVPIQKQKYIYIYIYKKKKKIYIYIYIYIYIISIHKLSFVSTGLGYFLEPDSLLPLEPARSAMQWRSKWQLEPVRCSSGARNGCSSSPRSCSGACCRSSPFARRSGARNGRSSPLGAAVALEMAARVRFGAAMAPAAARARSLCYAMALETSSRARSVLLEPALEQHNARNGRSRLLAPNPQP